MKTKYIQFTKNYDFINSWKLFPDFTSSDKEINNFLTSKFNEPLSFECFIDIPKGFKIVGYTCQNINYKEFINGSIEFAKSADKINSFINKTKNNEPDMIKVGILDHWFETGPCLLWQKGDPKSLEIKSIKNKLAKYPQIEKTNINPQGISFYYSQNSYTPEHWIMFSTNKKDGDEYLLDYDDVLKLIIERFS